MAVHMRGRYEEKVRGEGTRGGCEERVYKMMAEGGRVGYACEVGSAECVVKWEGAGREVSREGLFMIEAEERGGGGGE